jgi:tape measure domain-containing protein
MAKLGDLIVRIGADTRDLNKSLGRVQRNMRSMSSNFERLGQSMTRSLTLPIAAFGAAAVKSAADMEQLETSFVSLTGGAEQAAMMMKQLNEFTAQTPFQIEAVANAARQLIASGTEVGDVNQQLKFLGDIAATSGNSIEEIAAIFAKVNAKGKVELENLNQLAERGIPIFDALAEATGLPADKLGAGAVSVREFNEVLEGFAEQGGFAAGAMERMSETAAGRFSTAMDNMKLALASVGEKILPFVNKGLEQFTRLMQGFAQLSPTTLKLAGAIAAVAATIGPMIVVLPKLIGLITALKTSFLLTSPAILGVAAVAGTIIGLFARVAKEARGSAAEVREVQKAIEDLTKAELQRELGVTRGADREAVQNAIADATQRVAEANAELAKIEAKIQEGGPGLRAVYKNKIADIKEYRTTFERSVEAGEKLLEFFETQETKTTRASQSMSTLTTRTIQQAQANKQLQVTVWNVGDMVEETTQKFIDMGEEIKHALVGVAMSFDGTGGFMFKGLKALGDMLVSIGQKMIVTAEAFKQFKKFLIKNPALAVAAGIAFVVAGNALSNLATRQMEVPALAQGGVAYGPTMAMIGDNRNAAIDPEVVAPLSKVRDMMGGNQVEVFGRIQGNDIFLSNARTGTSRNRYA